MHLQGHVGREGRESVLGGSRHSAASGTRQQVTLQIGAERRVCDLSPQGYYAATLPVPDSDPAAGTPWRDILVITDTGHGARTAHHRVLIPRIDPTLLVIWDVDNTLVGVDAPAGAQELCRGLVHGSDHPGRCPAFFLSGRNWPQYLALSHQLAEMDVPEGPVLLNPAPPDGIQTEERQCKAGHLERILATYPGSPAVLVTTAPVLAEGALMNAVTAHEDRFTAVYALDAAPGEPSPRSITAAAEHAHARGLIGAPVLARIAADCRSR